MVENKIKFPSQLKLAEIERKLNSEDESQAPFIAMPTSDFAAKSFRSNLCRVWRIFYR